MADDVVVAEGGKAKGKGAGKGKGKEGGARAAGAKAAGPKAAGARAAGAKAGGKPKADKPAKADVAPMKVEEAQIARMLVRALWAQDWIVANPDKDLAARNAAWKDARQSQIETELKKIRRALMNLKRAGVTMTLAEKAGAEAEGDEMPADVAADDSAE